MVRLSLYKVSHPLAGHPMAAIRGLSPTTSNLGELGNASADQDFGDSTGVGGREAQSPAIPKYKFYGLATSPALRVFGEPHVVIRNTPRRDLFERVLTGVPEAECHNLREFNSFSTTQETRHSVEQKKMVGKSEALIVVKRS